MRFSTATTVTALALAGASVRAADYRQSIRAPANISMGLFEKAFFGMCAGFPPAHAADTAYSGPDALFEPGDFQGQNNDTVARAYCLYYSPDGSVIPMTLGVAQLLGGNSTEANTTGLYTYWPDGTLTDDGSLLSPGGASYSVSLQSAAVPTATIASSAVAAPGTASLAEASTVTVVSSATARAS